MAAVKEPLELSAGAIRGGDGLHWHSSQHRRRREPDSTERMREREREREREVFKSESQVERERGRRDREEGEESRCSNLGVTERERDEAERRRTLMAEKREENERGTERVKCDTELPHAPQQQWQWWWRCETERRRRSQVKHADVWREKERGGVADGGDATRKKGIAVQEIEREGSKWEGSDLKPTETPWDDREIEREKRAGGGGAGLW